MFMFDLTRKATLNSIKEWYRQARGFNKVSSDYNILLLGYSLTADCHPRPDWHKVRRVCHSTAGRAGGDHQAGEALLKGHACAPNLLLHFTLYQRAEDLQDRPRQGVRPEVRDPGDRGGWRAYFTVCRRLVYPFTIMSFMMHAAVCHRCRNSTTGHSGGVGRSNRLALCLAACLGLDISCHVADHSLRLAGPATAARVLGRVAPFHLAAW